MARAEVETVNQNRQKQTARRQAIAILSLIALAAPAAGQEVLTLQQALALALHNSAAIASQELQLQRAENDVEAAKTRRLPSFDFQAQASKLLMPIEMTFPAGSFGTFEGTGPIPAADAVIKGSTQPSASVSAAVVH